MQHTSTPNSQPDEFTTQPSLIYPVDSQTGPQHPTPPPRRHSRWGGVAAALVAAALIAAFIATLGPRIISPGSKSLTPTTTAGPRQTVQATPNPSSSATAIASPTNVTLPAGFVCANAPGSNATYAYINGNDGQVYEVTGCSAPRKLTNVTIQPEQPQGVIVTPFYPIAFSPTNKLLMLLESNQGNSNDCQVIVNTQSATLTQTPFCTQTQSANWSTWPQFIAWETNTSFLEAVYHPDGSVEIDRVNVANFAQTTITVFPWVANAARYNGTGIVLHNGSLYYAGYANGNTTQAALRRYTLATDANTQLVPLGIAGNAGCQGTPGPCGWTGPWDVSPDGTHIIYHNPGPQQSLSDTTNPPDTPLYYANSDGSGAVKIFDALAPSSQDTLPAKPTMPAIAPNGAYAVSDGYLTRVGSLATPDSGAVVTLPITEQFTTWRSDSAAFVVVVLSANSTTQYAENAVYTLSTGKLTPLTSNTTDYLWGN